MSWFLKLARRTLVMGTRGSPLALAQSRQVAAALQSAHRGLQVEERIIRTTGDRQQGQPLPQIGGKGVFTLEIEQALLSGEIDFAVHSLKDLPPDLPDGLCIGAIPFREGVTDVCVLSSALRRLSRRGWAEVHDVQQKELGEARWTHLPWRARVGTSSLRRRAQLLHQRPDLQIEDIRGNIDTRLRKLDDEGFDAIVLAKAGLGRLDLLTSSAVAPTYHLGKNFLPAPGQGALAVEARQGDEKVLSILGAIEHIATRAAVVAERAVMRQLGAGCSTPLGARAFAQPERDLITLRAVVLSPDGRKRIAEKVSARFSEAEAVGRAVAEKLLARGAAELLSYAPASPHQP